jgi:hypothetical protein
LAFPAIGLREEKLSFKMDRVVQQVVSEGRVVINLNGEPRNYFRHSKGLRQGGSIIPLTFQLGGRHLGYIYEKGQRCWPYQRPGIRIGRGGGVTHLQFADDIVICLETDEDSIENTKFLLYCFENMSGLKINYHKSEVIVLGSPVRKVAKLQDF